MAGVCDVSEGEISVCGVSREGLVSDAWRARVAYIPQHPYVFSGTLRDNVALYAPSASDVALTEALGRAGLAPLLASLPQGLDSIVGEAGRSLSGGEAHRVALARGRPRRMASG